ncbi:hypothetical protein Prudu_019477 [Prunus dulcis]|uniref:Uncharacterized protein n=1 Tax=Prunus dulcis TaxID=3755 RepID=A0A4Y1RUS9_PRUDU|nr:hypothetical protein Prudu_019477 [Prunus dulcis]
MYLYSYPSNREILAGYRPIAERRRRGAIYWTQAHNAKVLEEQVVHGLWGLGVSSREESCPAHSYTFPVYRSLAPSLKIVHV